MSNKLYTIGYGKFKPEQVKALVEKSGAVLVDVRFSPRSRNPQWAKSNVEKLVGKGNYLHLNSLGNRNYKGDGPIEIVDIERGTQAVATILETRSVILMCQCWDLAHCHRLPASEFIAQKLGVELAHLSPADLEAKEPAEPPAPLQPSLF